MSNWRPLRLFCAVRIGICIKHLFYFFVGFLTQVCNIKPILVTNNLQYCIQSLFNQSNVENCGQGRINYKADQAKCLRKRRGRRRQNNDSNGPSQAKSKDKGVKNEGNGPFKFFWLRTYLKVPRACESLNSALIVAPRTFCRLAAPAQVFLAFAGRIVV